MSEQAETVPIQADDPNIFQLLRKRHPIGEWAYLEEVAPRPIGGGFADAVAINLWNSRGYAIHGFEVKVSRRDWLRELKKPEKAEPIFGFCDYWFLVSEQDVVKPGELPATWGHLERRGSSLAVVKAAPKLTPSPITREFFASLVRRAHGQIEALADVRCRDKVAEAKGAIAKRVQEEVEHATRKHKELQAQVQRFTEQTGLRFDAYGMPPIETIKLAQKLQTLQHWDGAAALSRLSEMADGLERAAQNVREAIQASGLRDAAAQLPALRVCCGDERV